MKKLIITLCLLLVSGYAIADTVRVTPTDAYGRPQPQQGGYQIKTESNGTVRITPVDSYGRPQPQQGGYVIRK